MDIPAPGAEGVLFAHGSRFGGHALYVKGNRLHYVYNFVGMMEQKIDGTEDLPTGENLILSASFDKDGEDPPHVSTGILSLYHGDTKVGEGRIRTQPGMFSLAAARACASDATAGNPSPTITRGPTRTHSPGARSSASPSMSAAIPMSTLSAKHRPCSRANRRRCQSSPATRRPHAGPQAEWQPILLVISALPGLSAHPTTLTPVHPGGGDRRQRTPEGVDEQRTWPGSGRHGAVEELDAVGERVFVQVRILDYHDRILRQPVTRLRERQDGVRGFSAKLLSPSAQLATK